MYSENGPNVRSDELQKLVTSKCNLLKMCMIF